MSLAIQLLVNSRFLFRPLTGVDRIALELSRNMLRITRGAPATIGMEMIVPNNRVSSAEDILEGAGILARTKGFGFGSGHAWEQTALQWVSPKSTLLSFCNTGPIFRRNQFLFVADAQFVTHPQSYKLAFRLYFRLLLPFAARMSRHIATISEHSRENLESAGIFPKGKAHIIHCGSDHVLEVEPDDTVLDRLAVPPKSYFLMVGSLAPHKNMRFLISSLSGHLPAGTKLVIAGGGNSKVFQDSNITAGDDVILAGRMTDEELVALYRNAYALVFPSLTEGFGLPPVEAMRWGCPVIASTGGAIPEICGDAAMYVDATNAQGWVEATRNLWADKSRRQELVELGSQRCLQYSWSKSARQVLDIIFEN